MAVAGGGGQGLLERVVPARSHQVPALRKHRWLQIGEIVSQVGGGPGQSQALGAQRVGEPVVRSGVSSRRPGRSRAHIAATAIGLAPGRSITGPVAGAPSSSQSWTAAHHVPASS